MRERETVAHARWVGEQLAALLKPLLDEPGVHEIRRAGTMTGIELRRPDGQPFAPGRRTGFAVCRLARERGVFIRPLGDVVVLMPPLAIEYDDLALLADVTVESVRDVLADRR
jgi:adenosylmethionine-8-amino-7-oxononanoate aminotransferase